MSAGHPPGATAAEEAAAAPPPHVSALDAGFRAAVQQNPRDVRELACTFAGHPVLLRVAGRGFAERTQRAFLHLPLVGNGFPQALQVDLWDETETGVPWRGDVLPPPERAWLACGGRLGASADGRYVTFQYGDSITVLDRREQRMIGCRRNGSHLAGGEYSKPLLLLLSIWYYDRGVQLLHAGLIARGDAGLLLPGESGTGKSTTCLAAAAQGLDFLGDDFIGVQRRPDGTFAGHSIFNTACLHGANLVRFPELARFAVESGAPEEEKPILFLSEVFPERLRRTVPVRAVVLLRIRQDRTEIRRASRPEAMRAFAASTLHTVVPRPGREALRMLGEMVERLPAFWLLLGPDLDDIAPGVDRILEQVPPADGS